MNGDVKLGPQATNEFTDFMSPTVALEGPVRTRNIPRQRKRRMHHRRKKRQSARRT